MNNRVLLCSDLDRTLLPNGPQEESPQARRLLQKLARHPQLTLAYVSGRHKALIREAINSYQVPSPDYAIGDVGTTIYEITADDWHPWQAWSQEIAPDWQDMHGADLATLLQDIESLVLQEVEKQNTFKLSYYTPEDVDHRTLLPEVERRLQAKAVRASLIWSIDEMKGVGLLDILPERANKLHAIRFLLEQKGFVEARTVFAGDSGNDLQVLTSGLQAVLVRNARDDVRQEALEQAKRSGKPERLYVARGGFLGMNGNYAAGVLEGLAHFLPETEPWMRA